MKGFCIIVLLALSTRLLSQDFQLTTQGDTLTLLASNITADPFQFGNDPLTFLEKFNPAKTLATFKNIHEENKLDSIITLKIGQDTFVITKWANGQNGLFSADLTTRKFKTKHGLQIGMKKKEALQQLSKYNLKSIPTHLILEEIEVYQLIVLTFTAENLTSILFLGYAD